MTEENKPVIIDLMPEIEKRIKAEAQVEQDKINADVNVDNGNAPEIDHDKLRSAIMTLIGISRKIDASANQMCRATQEHILRTAKHNKILGKTDEAMVPTILDAVKTLFSHIGDDVEVLRKSTEGLWEYIEKQVASYKENDFARVLWSAWASSVAKISNDIYVLVNQAKEAVNDISELAHNVEDKMPDIVDSIVATWNDFMEHASKLLDKPDDVFTLELAENEDRIFKDMKSKGLDDTEAAFVAMNRSRQFVNIKPSEVTVENLPPDDTPEVDSPAAV